ncbi:MAG: hypothetical protein LBM97_02445 [Candidatus Nomurabacteria bacterium]|nr:hypothetical protein [Candidatus Nomurabacteria bacterium]
MSQFSKITLAEAQKFFEELAVAGFSTPEQVLEAVKAKGEFVITASEQNTGYQVISPNIFKFFVDYLPDADGESGLFRTLRYYWDKIDHEKTNYRSDEWSTDRVRLNAGAGGEWIPGTREVTLDWDAYAGLSPEEAQEQAKKDGVQLAGVEILAFMALHPSFLHDNDWKTVKRPNLSGIDYLYGNSTDWSDALYLHRGGSGPELSADCAGLASAHFASPSLRI